MNAFEQFLEMLNTLPDGEDKQGLVDAFPRLQGAFNDAVKTRDSVRTTNSELRGNIDAYKKAIGYEDETLDGLEEFIAGLKKPSKNDDALKQAEEKHAKELGDLRDILTQEQGKSKQMEEKYNDMLFKNEIEAKGLLEGFTQNPLMRGMIVDTLKSKLLYEDGKIFVRGDDGKPQTDIKTGDPISPASAVDGIKKDPLYAEFLAPSGAAGGGMQNNGQSGGEQNRQSYKEKRKSLLGA